MLLASHALAEIDVIGVDGRNADEDATNAQTFKDMVKRCKLQSPAFKKAYEQIDNDKSRKITIRVGRGTGGLDSADGPGDVSVDLNGLDQLKDPAKQPDGSYKMPPSSDGKGVAWWMTKCEDIIHFTWEAYETYHFRDYYTWNGHTWVNKNDHEFDLDRVHECHDAGVKTQNQVRKDFGQDGEDTCRHSKAKNPKKDTDKQIGYDGTDGQHHTVNNPYVLINYGHKKGEKFDRQELIIFFPSGRIEVHFLTGSPYKEIPETDIAKPVPATTEKTDDTKKPDDKTGGGAGGTGGGTTGGDKSTGGGGGGALKSLLPVIPLLGGGHGEHRGGHRQERVHHDDKTTTKRTGPDSDKVTPPRTTDAPKTDAPRTDTPTTDR